MMRHTLLLCAALLVVACGPSGPYSPENNLATIQNGSRVSDSDALTKKFAHQLDVMGQNCSEDRKGLGDLVGGANGALKDHSISEPMLTTANAVNELIIAGRNTTASPCQPIFVLYVQYRWSNP